MKNNLPVTDREYPFPAGKILVSKTDLKGVITYANDAFIEVSGFTEQDLIGRAHNIVRHPSMPPAAFQELWDTVRAGKPWRRVVKNRRKNGDHYWVEATVVPVRKNNQTVGYMSVRKAPSREQIQAAEALYARMAKHQVSSKKPGLVDKLLDLPLLAQYSIHTGALALSTVAIWLLSEYRLLPYVAVLSVLQIAGMLGSVLYFRQRLARPFDSAMLHFDAMAQGNLNTDVDVYGKGSGGKLLASIAYMQAHFRVITDEIRVAATRMSEQAVAALAEVDKVSEQSVRQSDRVSEVSAAMEQLTVSSAEVAEKAVEAANAAKSSFATVEKGKEYMASSMAASSQVVEASNDTDGVLAELAKAADGISNVTRVISEVATQTNLLALNASIEAARAGENGRGFAVVADEVRKLAERTKSSTSEIEHLVSSVQSLSIKAANSMKAALSGVSEEQHQLHSTERGFAEIEATGVQVLSLAEQIAASAKEQSSANENIARSMEAMAVLIEQNMQSVNGAHAAVESATAATQALQQVLLHFQEGEPAA
jgi:aerotaxis receptor